MLPVLRIRIRIHRIHVFLGLLDPDPFVRGMDPYPDPSSFSKKIVRKTLIPTVLWLLFDFLPLKNNVKVPSKSNMQKNFFYTSFLLAFEGQRWKKKDPDPLVRGMDPRIRIRIHTKMSWICNTGCYEGLLALRILCFSLSEVPKDGTLVEVTCGLQLASLESTFPRVRGSPKPHPLTYWNKPVPVVGKLMRSLIIWLLFHFVFLSKCLSEASLSCRFYSSSA